MLENPRQIELLLPILAVLCNNIGVIASPMRGRITKAPKRYILFPDPCLPVLEISLSQGQIERFVRNQHSSKDILMPILRRTLFSF